MKPVYLEFCGLNSFSSKAEIDFSTLLSGGLFGIFGATGSGKSSILDAIHLALYGKVDRVSTFNDCINQNCDSVSVLFDFEVLFAGKRGTFRVKRETKRKSGSAKAYLYERKDGQWYALAEGVSDVNKKVEEIVGLSFEDFKTCIALPQGDFATLVKSKVSERVKLMARLFNLEKYGERMYKAVNARYIEAEKETQLLLAQMSENEGADDEKIAQAEADVTFAETQTLEAKAQAECAGEIERKALELQKEKTAYIQALQRFSFLQSQYGEMQTLENLLNAYPMAKAVVDSYTAWEKMRQTLENALRNVEMAKAEYCKAVECVRVCKERKEQSDVGQRLENAKLELAKWKDGAEDIAREEKCRADLEACRKEYNACKFDGAIEDIVAKRKQLELQRDALGEDEDMLSFLQRNVGGIFLAEAYGEMRKDLKNIADKYPQAQEDVGKLIKKYTYQNQGQYNENAVAEAQLRYKKIEQERKQLKQQIEYLEKREQAYKDWENKRKEIASRGTVLGEAHKLALEKVAVLRALGTEKELLVKVQTLQTEEERLKKSFEDAQALQVKTEAKVGQWTHVAEEYATAERQAESNWQNVLKEGAFASVDEAKQVLLQIGNERMARAKTDAFFKEYAVFEERVKQADKAKLEAFDETSVCVAQKNRLEAEEKWMELNRGLGAKQNRLSRLLNAKEKYQEQLKDLQEKQKKLKVCEELRSLVHGNKFLEFVASEYLQSICQSASKTLLSLTNRKYFLKYEDKEFKVGDNLHGGALRTARTLSGGETFLVSLSLALALSNAICQQSARPSEFFFLDEGFGTLDENLVETVMDVLGKLSQSFAVGLISHVEELKRRISCKALVTGATETRSSSVKIECFG